jgi:hypothetical protein
MVWRLLLLIVAPLIAAPAQAEEKEPTAIVQIGGAGEWGLSGPSAFGPSVAVEFIVIKDWLEIEAGVAPLFRRGRVEWDTGVLFKKPFTLSNQVEFMIGAGPQWTVTREGTKIGGEVRSIS